MALYWGTIYLALKVACECLIGLLPILELLIKGGDACLQRAIVVVALCSWAAKLSRSAVARTSGAEITVLAGDVRFQLHDSSSCQSSSATTVACV